MHGHSGWVSSPASLISRHDETSPKLNRDKLKIKKFRWHQPRFWTAIPDVSVPAPALASVMEALG